MWQSKWEVRMAGMPGAVTVNGLNTKARLGSWFTNNSRCFGFINAANSVYITRIGAVLPCHYNHVEFRCSFQAVASS